jgi:two-component sensor histidine kinase
MFWGYSHSTNRLFFDDFVAILIFIELGAFLLISGIVIHYFLSYTLKKLEISNAEKEILLQEVHHRVKNNLNMMSSILGLQTNSPDKNVQALVKSNRQRLESIAMVHELLYKHDDYLQIDFGLYVNKLAQHLVYACSTVPIKMNIETNDIKLSLETMTHLGLVVQELLSNSLKYAFTGKGEINIELRKEDEKYILDYFDSGTSSVEEISSKGLGLELIELKVRQLSGTVTLTHTDGFVYSIEFYDEE